MTVNVCAAVGCVTTNARAIAIANAALAARMLPPETNPESCPRFPMEIVLSETDRQGRL
jgi:hypothetical protein